jgi:hypothetical protein
MKKGLKIVFGVIGCVYLIVAIFGIACLLKKNEFGYPQFGSKTLLVIDEDNAETKLKKGDLLVLVKPNNDDVKISDGVFFYDTEYKKNTINYGKVTAREVINEKETTFSIGSKKFSSEYLVGKLNDSKKYGTIGSILNVLISKWGFFLIVIVPFFVIFMIELFAIYTEIKYGKKKKNN